MHLATDPLFDLKDDNDLFIHDNPLPKTDESGPALYRAVCRKCSGTGNYVGPSSYGRHCFDCKGKGFQEYKRSEQERHAARERRQARKLRQEHEKQAEKQNSTAQWLAEHPVEAAWLQEGIANQFDFAVRLNEGLQKFGSLTENQLAAIHRNIEARAASKAAREEAIRNAPVVDIQQIEAAFQRAAPQLRWPKLRLGHYVFSLAPKTSKNAGSIYVKRCASGDIEQEYLGKITDGKFYASRDCTDEDKERILEVASRPREAAEKYGRLTGNCAVCARPLTREESVGRGIGPICAERFFGMLL